MTLSFRHKLSVGFASALLMLFHVASAPDAVAQRRAGRSKQTSGATGAAQAGESRPNPHVEEAQRHAEAGNWAEAIKSYRQAVAANPKDGDAHVGLGDAYMSAGKYEEAFAAYREAVRVAPWNPDAHYSLGAAYNDMAQYGDSFKHFVQTIRLDSNYAEAYYGIGYAYQNLENYKEALGYLRSALRLRPDHAEAHLSLGRTYLGLGNVKGAEEQLRVLEASDATLAKELDREIQKAAGAARIARQTSPDAAPVAQPSPTPRRESTPPEKGRRTAAAPPPQPSARPGRADASPASNASANNSASLLAVELSFWDSIKNSSDPEEFQAYLRKYPEGQFSELARIRLRALGGKRTDAGATEASSRQEEAPQVAAAEPQPTPREMPEPTPEPTPVPTPAPTPTPQPLTVEPSSSATLEETLDWLRKNFAASFNYKYTTAGDTPTEGEAVIIYEPLRFEGCGLEWRDGADTLSVSLSDLDPLNIKVEPRKRANTTFAVEVWNVNLNATGGKLAFREARGDGSDETNTYSGINLQFDDRERAERMARVLRHAAKLCAGRAAP